MKKKIQKKLFLRIFKDFFLTFFRTLEIEYDAQERKELHRVIILIMKKQKEVFHAKLFCLIKKFWSNKQKNDFFSQKSHEIVKKSGDKLLRFHHIHHLTEAIISKFERQNINGEKTLIVVDVFVVNKFLLFFYFP